MKRILQKLKDLKIAEASCFKAASVLFGVILFPSLAYAQIQQAWVARYDNGFPGGTNQAVKMALDSSANILVTGFSQNTNINLGYATIKYGPNGTPFGLLASIPPTFLWPNRRL